MRSYSSLIICLAISACATTPAARTDSLQSPTPSAPDRRDQVASAITPIASLSAVAPFLATLPKGQTLVIFDIDDTLLTASSPAFFGSDLWYNWQKAGAPGGSKVKCMTDILALNYQAASQRATESLGPTVLKDVTHDKLILTSRSPNYRDATERELLRAGYSVLTNIPSSKPGVGHGTAFRHPDAPSERDRKFVTYANGIFMTEGGDKGAMLLYLLKHLESTRAYQNIVLVDDTWSKQTDMQKALESQPYRFYGLHYRGVKNDTADGWLKLAPWQFEEAARHEKAFQEVMATHYPDFSERCMTSNYLM
jgi:hypothetical protein